MPIDSRSWRQANLLAGGKLEAIIRDHLAGGLSITETGKRLYADHSIEVSVTTLSKWVTEGELAAADPEQGAA